MYRRGTVTGRLGGFDGPVGGGLVGSGAVPIDDGVRRAARLRCVRVRMFVLVCVTARARTGALRAYVLPFDNHAIRARKKYYVIRYDILHNYCTGIVRRGRETRGSHDRHTCRRRPTDSRTAGAFAERFAVARIATVSVFRTRTGVRYGRPAEYRGRLINSAPVRRTAPRPSVPRPGRLIPRVMRENCE